MSTQATARDILLSIYSDTFKELNGFRPTGMLFPSDRTEEEIDALLAGLEADRIAQQDEERYQEEQEQELRQTLYARTYGEEN